MGLACAGRNLVVFGGNPVSGDAFGDTWLYVNKTWVQIEPAVSPPPRADAAFVAFDDDSVVLYGGFNASSVFADAWRYTVSTSSWSQLNFAPPLPPLTCSCAASLPNGFVVLYGGHPTPSELSPTTAMYLLHPASQAWQDLTQPASDHAPLPIEWAACGTVGATFWLSDGFNGSIEMSDLWNVDLSAYVTQAARDRMIAVSRTSGRPLVSPPHWTRISADGAWPTARSGHVIILDQSTRELYLSGGEVHLSYASPDLWRLARTDDDGYTWQNVTTALTHPTPRLGARAAQCSDGSAAIFGGVDGWINPIALNDLWLTSAC